MPAPLRAVHRPRTRRGATLVELLVALLLFDLALLTVVAMSAVAVRQIGDAGRRNRAAIASSSRIEWLAARGCAPSASGTTLLERGVTESWTSSSIHGGRELVDSVHIDSRTPERVVLRARVPC